MLKLAVVIVTRNRPALLEQTLQTLVNQETTQRWESLRIVVFDDRSDFNLHLENESVLQLIIAQAKHSSSFANIRSKIPRLNHAYYWDWAIREHIADANVIAFLPEYAILKAEWWQTLSRPIRAHEAQWSWARVTTERQGKIVKRWGGENNLAALRHGNYINLSGALFCVENLRPLTPLAIGDLAIYHYIDDLVLRAALNLKGSFLDELVAEEMPLDPLPYEDLAALHPNEQSIHLGWWSRHREKLLENVAQSHLSNRARLARPT